MNTHLPSYNFDGPLIGKYFKKGQVDELGRRITSEKGWVDGGDTCQRVGMYHAGLHVYEKLFGKAELDKFIKEQELLYTDPRYFGHCLVLLECKQSPGIYRRHTDNQFWYSDCDRMSRDQAFPLVVAMGLLGKRKELWRFFKAHLRRGLLFMYNARRNGATKENHGTKHSDSAPPLTDWHKFILEKKIPWLSVPKGWRNYNLYFIDLTGPAFWALYIRGFKLWWLYPLLCILDIEFFLNSILLRFIKDKNDTINHSVESMYCGFRYVTPLGWIANRFINSSSDLNGRSNRYFSNPGEPYFIDYLYRRILDKLLRK